MSNQPQQYSKYKPLIFVSGLYLLIIMIIAVGKLNDFADMSPNEWGDFLAGTFAPLAFMWLVFGYRLQGEELKQNTEALRLQSEELANSVEQQRQLVDTARQELNLTINQINQKNKQELIQAQPFIHIKTQWAKKILKSNVHASSSANLAEEFYDSIHFYIDFINSRSIGRELVIEIYYDETLNIRKNYSLFLSDNHDYYDAGIFLPYPICFTDKDFINLKVKFEYLDSLDEKQYQNFNFEFMLDDQFKLSPVLYTRSSTSFQND